MKFLLLLFFFVVTACDTKIKNFEKYTKAPLLELEEMPSKEEIKRTIPRILIVKTESESEEIKKSNANNIIAEDIAKILHTEQFAKIIERDHSEKAKQEIKIAELSGKGGVDGKAIDYIVNIAITNVTFSRQNLMRAVPIISQNNISISTRSIYQYTSTVDGVIKIFKLPKMEIVKTIDINSSYIENENATVGNSRIEVQNFSFDTSQKIDAKNYDSNVVYQAIKRAVQNAERDIKKFFQKKGYVLEKRALKKKYIFAINIGEKNGIKPQSKVAVVRTNVTTNPLTDEEEEVQETICTGIIADKVFKKRAWIVFEKTCQNKVRLGDKVQVIY